jgi:hypothetical protein
MLILPLYASIARNATCIFTGKSTSCELSAVATYGVKSSLLISIVVYA